MKGLVFINFRTGMPNKNSSYDSHSSLKMTMDRYVHVTDDSMEMGIRLFEQGQLENGLAAAE